MKQGRTPRPTVQLSASIQPCTYTQHSCKQYNHTTTHATHMQASCMITQKHTHLYMQNSACMRMCTKRACMHACMHTCISACMHACISACMHACMHLPMYACVHACLNPHRHICTHAHMLTCIHQFIHSCRRTDCCF